jgi:hypothetical protein
MSVHRNLKTRHIFAQSAYFNKSSGQIVDYLVLYRSKKTPLESDCLSICNFAGTIFLQISIQKHTILFLLAFLSYSLPFSQKSRSAVGRGYIYDYCSLNAKDL